MSVDVEVALEVVAAGGQAIGTSSNAIAATLGEPDDNTMAIAQVFGAIKRISTSVPVPVNRAEVLPWLQMRCGPWQNAPRGPPKRSGK